MNITHLHNGGVKCLRKYVTAWKTIDKNTLKHCLITSNNNEINNKAHL